MPYRPAVELQGGLTPKNNRDFPLVNAKDVYVSDEERLDDAIDRLNNKIVAITQEEYESGNWTAPEGAIVVVMEAEQ